MLILVKVPAIIIINFLYRFLPFIKPFIEKNISNPYYFGSSHEKYISGLFTSFSSQIRKYSTLKGKTLLELGPGGSIDFGLAALKNGVSHYYAIDDGNHLASRSQSVNAGLLKKITFISISQKSEYSGIPDGKIDFIYSCAVLEHVHDLDLCFREMTRVLKKGGLMVHQVDLRDHVFNQNSDFFLSVPEFWFKMLFGSTGGYVNRKRLDYYLTLFKNRRLRVESLSCKYYASKPPTDINAQSFNVVLRKQ